VSLLQRRLSVGYARASRMIEMMAALGILGEYKGSQAREVIVTLEEYEDMQERMDAQAEDGRQKTEDSGDESEDEDLPGPSYVKEGQRGYVSVDKEAD
jgi:S-DNA-T family DNA segregation ATPase FtsK/SpoIIIE